MYKIIVNLLPQNATLAQKWTALQAVHAVKETMLQSADDAVVLVLSGTQASKVKVWWPEQWPDPIVPWLLARGVPNIEVHPINPPAPVPNPGVKIGLHASADPGDLSEAEFAEFRAMRPGVIKVLSAHSGGSVARLANENPQAVFVVRAFLDFGDRVVTPDEFVNWTKDDVIRTVNNIPVGREVWLELHNEPNLLVEGLGLSWSDGYAFGDWLNSVASQYKVLVPSLKLLYPGLSPGSTIPGIRQDHIQFIEQSRSSVNALHGLGIHLYWSDSYPMSSALNVLDDYIIRFPGRPIWITESSQNKPGPTALAKAGQYLDFWDRLKSKAQVQGVTYFVSSSSNQAFGWTTGSCETWLENGVRLGIGERIGQR